MKSSAHPLRSNHDLRDVRFVTHAFIPAPPPVRRGPMDHTATLRRRANLRRAVSVSGVCALAAITCILCAWAIAFMAARGSVFAIIELAGYPVHPGTIFAVLFAFFGLLALTIWMIVVACTRTGLAIPHSTTTSLYSVKD